MVDIKTEEKLKKISADYVYNEAVGSLLLVLMSAIEDIERDENEIPYEIHSDIKEIKEAIKHYIIKIEDILNGDKEVITASLEDCFDIKKSIVSIYENIYRYFASWGIYSAPVTDEVAIRKYREENVSDKKIEFDMFYNDCVEFLTTAENPVQQKNFMGQLLKCVPLKMARQKYFDIIKQSLNIAFGGESEESIKNALKTIESACAPEKQENYGKYFPELAEWLSEKKNIIPENLSDQELDEEYTDFNSVFDTLNKIEDYFAQMFNDINSLIIIFYTAYTFEELTENDFEYSDLYHSVCEILTGETNAETALAFTDTLNERLEVAFEPIIDKANALSKEELKIIEKVGSFENLSDETAKSIMSDSFVRSMYYGDINDEIFNFNIDTNLPPASVEFKSKVFDEFIDVMKEYFVKLPSKIRKLSMQLLLSSLPPAFTVEEAINLIKNAMEDTPDFEHKVLMVDKAGMVFTDNGYDYRTEEEKDEDWGLMDYQHDHNCSCGHDHHHDYNCSCGHDHHHDHNCSCGHDHHHDHDCDCGHHHK